MLTKLNNLKAKYADMPVALKATFWFLICSFVQRGISVITTPIFTRLMSTAEYGAFNVFTSWQSILTVIVTLNLPWGVYGQGLVKFEERKKKFAASLQVLLLLLVIAWTIIYLPFREFFNNILSMTTSKMFAMFIMMWTSSVFCFWSASERVDFQYKKLVLLTIIVAIAKPVLGIILVSNFTDKVTVRIWGLAMIEIICYSGLFAKQLREGKGVDIGFWKYALAFNITLIPHYLSQTILSGADRIMIEKMIGSDEAGIYSLAYSLSLLMLVFNSSMGQTLGPWIFKKIKAKDFDEIPRVVYPAMAAVGILNLMLMLFAPEIVKIFAPTSYYGAIWVVPPVAMSVFFMFTYDMFANFEFYYEKTKYMSIATVLGAGINIILNYFFIRIFGYYAAGYTTLVCYICYAIFHYCVMRFVCLKDEKSKVYRVKTLLAIDGIFMVCGFLILATYRMPVIRYSMMGIAVVGFILARKRIITLIKQFIGFRKAG